MTTVKFEIPNSLDRVFAAPVLLYRLFKYGYTFRKIYLGEGLYAIVEPQDYYWLNNFNWYLGGNGTSFYAFRNTAVRPGKVKMDSMHRIIMDAPPRLIVDHKNGNTLDNRRSNLRLCTQSQNMHNRVKKKNTTSRFFGVFLDKRYNKWIARIRVEGEVKCLGTYVKEEEAAKAYDAAARKYYGEFANLNFTEE